MRGRKGYRQGAGSNNDWHDACSVTHRQEVFLFAALQVLHQLRAAATLRRQLCGVSNPRSACGSINKRQLVSMHIGRDSKGPAAGGATLTRVCSSSYDGFSEPDICAAADANPGLQVPVEPHIGRLLRRVAQ